MVRIGDTAVPSLPAMSDIAVHPTHQASCSDDQRRDLLRKTGRVPPLGTTSHKTNNGGTSWSSACSGLPQRVRPTLPITDWPGFGAVGFVLTLAAPAQHPFDECRHPAAMFTAVVRWRIPNAGAGRPTTRGFRRCPARRSACGDQAAKHEGAFVRRTDASFLPRLDVESAPPTSLVYVRPVQWVGRRRS